MGRALERETASEDMQTETVLGVAEYPSLVDGHSFFDCFFDEYKLYSVQYTVFTLSPVAMYPKV